MTPRASMNIFKSVFNVIYIATILAVLVVSFNIIESLELFKNWGWYKYFSDLPFLGRNLLLFLCFLMSMEFVLERVMLKKQKGEMVDNEAKIKDLENQLYEKSQEELARDGFQELEDEPSHR